MRVRKREHGCQCCISRQGSAFSSAEVNLFLLGPVSFFVCLDVCFMFYSKSPWEARAFAVACSDNFMPFFSFATLPGDKQVLSLVLFVSGMLPNPQLCIPPPVLQRYSVRKGAWSNANPNRDLPVYPLSALTLAGVAYGLFKAKDRQAGLKLLGWAPVFAHAWC